MFNLFKKYREVTNPYKEDNSANYKGILLKGTLDSSIINFIKKRNIEALYISHISTTPFDLTLLSHCVNLKEINIITSSVSNIENLYAIKNVEDISISCLVEEIFNFCNFKKLKKASIPWNKNINSIFNCETLETLHIYEILDKNISFETMKNLKEIDVRDSNFDDFSFLKNNINLMKIRSDGNKLSSLDGISNLANLKNLMIRHSKELCNINPLKNLPDIQILILDDIGNIEDSTPLHQLTDLVALSLNGKTNLKDGNLFFIESFKNLSMLSISNHKHYSHKSIRSWNWNDLNKKGLSLFVRKEIV